MIILDTCGGVGWKTLQPRVRRADLVLYDLKWMDAEDHVKHTGVRIEYVLYDYPDTPEGALMKNIRASFAEFERAKITERNNRGRRLKVKGGSVLCYGRAPYGYRLEKTEKGYGLAVYEPEARVVCLIFRWFTQDLLALNEIKRRLTAIGAPLYEKPLRADADRKWTITTIRALLANETYVGTWHFGKRDNHGKVRPRDQWMSAQAPTIVSSEDFSFAQYLLSQDRERHSHATNHEHLMARRV